ncbi:HhH-GPD-type base excision DNA repair protein [Gaiella sp.]|uniref:HhH-GPD-type base excision DNA repair protein n=1 Tax=Gaiella sp. TaxID=2663207 RepID=UPI0032662B27
MPQAEALHFTGDPEADAFLAASPLALLIGFVLDQQITVQKAFSSPLELSKRLGGALDATAIAAMDPDALVEAFREKPALHRFPANMARRVQEHCAFLVSDYGGDPAAVWKGARDGAELERRLLELPGIGEMKARTMMGVLAKRLGVRPEGWEAFAPTHESLGDVDSPEALAEYQAAKRARKAAYRAKEST